LQTSKVANIKSGLTGHGNAAWTTHVKSFVHVNNNNNNNSSKVGAHVIIDLKK